MSTTVFPTLVGLGWDIKRSSEWPSAESESISGKTIRQAYWSYPRYHWELTYPLLRQGLDSDGTLYTDFQQLLGMYDGMKGPFDTFLYPDQDDYTVTNQLIGTGDSSKTTFLLQRTFGSTAPVFAPNPSGGVTNLKVNGVVKTFGVDWTVSLWGSATPGVVTFLTGAPTAGFSITADLNYYWPCTFEDGKLDFNKFMKLLYEAKSVKFKSVK